MNPAERLELIRRKFKPVATETPKPAGLHVTKHPEKRRTPRGKPKPYMFGNDDLPRFTIHAKYTGNERELGQGAEWLAVPIKVPKKCLAPKRTKKVSPLTRISQLLPMKLKKVPTAEH